jgi:hypothetical protein
MQQSMSDNKKTTSILITDPDGEIDNEFEGCYYKPSGKEDKTLVFESRFESGNLAMAAKVIIDNRKK